MTEQQLTDAVVSAARKVLADGMKKIDHCLGQLNDAQIWWRPNPEITEPAMNSIANLLLHLSGNIRQWIVSGLGGTPDNRNRPLEFSDSSGRPKAEILATLKTTIADADAALAKLKPADLLSTRHIQGNDVNATAALFKCLTHFHGHVQEIIHLTRNQLGNAYKFEFVPKAPK
jgi:hypothetical protein